MRCPHCHLVIPRPQSPAQKAAAVKRQQAYRKRKQQKPGPPRGDIILKDVARPSAGP